MSMKPIMHHCRVILKVLMYLHLVSLAKASWEMSWEENEICALRVPGCGVSPGTRVMEHSELSMGEGESGEMMANMHRERKNKSLTEL